MDDTDSKRNHGYKFTLNKIQEVYRFELERLKHSEEECIDRIHELLRQQCRTRSGSFTLKYIKNVSLA